ncbi:pilus assembly FimT family protein [Stieleria varia]|uniref:Uncharacterized protein n=1 Tax=Stieleria varia TaxID=2528005 RepID=A0A5C6B780_9BACT|nr:type II secretion system protein [Stieleria varia]TWU07442.1 hypothetical protein Pla52n_00150 [Stieleria varia]
MSQGDPVESERPDENTRRTESQFTLRELMLCMAVVALVAAYLVTQMRLRTATTELQRLRAETGYLASSSNDQIAAVRVPSDDPLTYRFRVRVPPSGRYRIAYSSLWPENTTGPSWYAAVDLEPGESLATVRILKDPRDDRWKITTLVRSERGTKRVGTVLPGEHTDLFLKSNDRMSLSIGQDTVFADKTESLRLVDERWIVGENGLLLYGGGLPKGDQIGVFAELQPDIGPL